MTRVRGRRALLLLALFASFSAGVFVDGWLRTDGPTTLVQAVSKAVRAAAEPWWAPAEPIVAAAPPPVNQLAGPADPPTMEPAPIAATEVLSATPLRVDYLTGPVDPPTMTAAPIVATGALSATPLRMPIDGISIESFKGGFSELRGSRLHEAVDIVVPRGTPIHAVQDGTIAKLFFSQAGGTTIYQFDPDGRFCYYYAHLERYADGLHDGQPVSRGEVIGYVGTSGNSPPDTPHLHFAIFELNADRKWWQGRPLDPYLVFKEKG